MELHAEHMYPNHALMRDQLADTIEKAISSAEELGYGVDAKPSLLTLVDELRTDATQIDEHVQEVNRF